MKISDLHEERPARAKKRKDREERKDRDGNPINESKWLFEEESRTHMTHLEDLVFSQGHKGAKQALNYLANVAGMLSGHGGKNTKITTKWDGAPAIVAGTDPKDGKFFVATKHGFFNAVPKLNKTPKDIDKNHSDAGLAKGKTRAGLRNKFKMALKELKALNFDGILHGDFMFAKGDLKSVTIEGEKYVAFKPQEIMYAVPADSELAQQLLAADFGIVWHTQYTGGPEISDMQTQYGVIAPKGNKKVWMDDATYKDLTGVATLTAKETDSVRRGIEKMSDILSKSNASKFNAMLKNEEFMKYIPIFINEKIRQGEGQVSNATQFLQDFINYYDDRMQKEIDGLKKGIDSPAGQVRVQKMEANKKFIEDNSNTLLAILGIYKQIIQLKMILVNKLNKVETIGMFYKTDDGYEVADPEGFVAIDRIGNAVKLVNRMEFSRRNFLSKKEWG